MRRLVQRRMQGDDGSTLIETVVALVVFALIMSGLAASMVVFARSTTLTKARSAATALAQKQVETARSVGTTNLAVCTGGASPLTYTFKGISYPVLTATGAGCLPFQTTTSSNGYTFTVKQYVLIPPSPTQAAAVIQTKTNTAGVPQTQKLLVVQLSWTAPTTGSYELDTIMNNNDAVNPIVPQGVRVSVVDSTGALINLPNMIWDYEIRNSANTVVASNSTEDGTTEVLSLLPGSYTCTITANADTAPSYSPGSNAGMTVDMANDTITGPCNVTSNTVTDWTTTWAGVSSCGYSSSVKGTLSVYVTDSASPPAALPGVLVALTSATSHSTGIPAAVTTDANGLATFTGNVPDDLYTYTLSKTAYTTRANLGPVCVAGTATSNATGSLTASGGCPTLTTKGSVSVTVVDEAGTPVASAKVLLTSQPPAKAWTNSVNTNASGVATWAANSVLGGSYTYTMSKTGYTNPGAQGPICVSPGQTKYVQDVLPTSGSTGCASTSSKGSLSVTVTDAAGTAISGAKVTLTNANGHAGTPAPITTGASGVVLFNNNVPGDQFLIDVTPPTGYSKPDTIGPQCVIAGQVATVSATVVGIMTTQINVTNSDTQPTKTYNVIITDSSGSSTSNSVTINQGKNATVTFSAMPTDDYTLSVCVPVLGSGNCDAVNDASVTYTWGAKGTTYLTNIVDHAGGV